MPGYRSAQEPPKPKKPSQDGYQSALNSDQKARFREIAQKAAVPASAPPKQKGSGGYKSAAMSPAQKSAEERRLREEAKRQAELEKQQLAKRKSEEAAKLKAAQEFLKNLKNLDPFDADRMFFESLRDHYDSEISAALDMLSAIE